MDASVIWDGMVCDGARRGVGGGERKPGAFLPCKSSTIFTCTVT